MDCVFVRLKPSLQHFAELRGVITAMGEIVSQMFLAH
jgi:hypothetical protein